jgi:starch synthase (maltosyl-transferring)
MTSESLPALDDASPPGMTSGRTSDAPRRATDAESAGPRIYDLFPRLVGSVRAWAAHLPRIAGMGFDWVYVNSFHATGRSGSLYAVSDPFALNPEFANAAGSGDDALREFTAAAARHGLKVMMDLTIAYLARDSQLAADHPDWFLRRPDGEFDNPGPWNDLAALNYAEPQCRAALTAFWERYIRHYHRLGFGGFVCKTAQLVPADIWRALIGGARAHGPLTFVADTVGAPIEAAEGLAGAGFDYLFNSAKWWDLRADWALEQQARLRAVAPTIAFPESHDTPRIAAGADDRATLEARLKFQLSLAATFSAGWMMPVGVEYGFTRALDVVHTRPDDWEPAQVDLCQFIAALNAARTRAPALSREGLERRITARDHPLVGLLRLSDDHPLTAEAGALLILNPDTASAHAIDSGALLGESGGRLGRWSDVTPARTPVPLVPGTPISLAPLEVRLFAGETVTAELPLPDRAASERAARRAARNRVVIENVEPEIDGGRHPVKRIVGDVLEIAADIFVDGHDQIAACIRYQEQGADTWHEAPMAFLDNDRWTGRVPLARNTTYLYTIHAWRDRFESWRVEFAKRRAAGQDRRVELAEAIALAKTALDRCGGADRDRLDALLARCDTLAEQPDELERVLLSDDLRAIMRRHGERGEPSRYLRELAVIVDRPAARFSAWYELFPRSQTGTAMRSGTFDDVIRHLPYVRSLGFDVLYFPPIHPIGRTNRKGRNNALTAGPHDPGSPYAIGSEAGGHTAVHPDLGTLADFRRLVRAAQAHGLEVALDFAVQCSLDHPWIKEHPEWFDWRADGSIKFAENPPKKYEDIVNPNFYSGLPKLWLALRDVVLFWIEQGVKIFRVDNPHTKPVPFWEWMIGEVRARHPEVIFLAEAFTRPKMMRRLAKAGFSQSYTYFTWRNTKRELTEYLTELTQTEMKEYFRPNFFANTPDINPVILQTGGRPAFMIRAALAATLSPSYGLYSGFELCEAEPLPGREEYLDAEKYEIKPRDWDRPGHIRDYIAALNRIRRDNPALHDGLNLRFYNADDEYVLVYGKATRARDNVVLVAVNLDPLYGRGSRFEVPLWEFGLPDDASIDVEDLLTGRRFTWHGKFQSVWLDPRVNPAALWRLAGPA